MKRSGSASALFILGAVMFVAMSVIAVEAHEPHEGESPFEDGADGFLQATHCEVSEAFLPPALGPRCAKNETADQAEYDERLMLPMAFEPHPEQDIAYALFSVDHHVRLVAVDAHTGERQWGVDHPVATEGQDVSADWMDLAVGPNGERVYVAVSALISVWEGGKRIDVVDAGLVLSLDAANGDIAWRTMDRSIGMPVVTTDTGGEMVYVTGRDRPDPDDWSHYDVVTKALDADTGAQIWKNAYTEGETQNPRDIEVDSDTGTVAIAGRLASITEDGNTSYQSLTFGLDGDTGELAWSDTFEAANSPEPNVVAQEGTIWTSANVGPYLDALDIRTREINASTGEVQWSHTYTGPSGGADYVDGLHVTSDTVIVHGISTVGPDVLLPGVLHAGIRDWDAHVLAIDRADGNERWVTFTDHPRTPFSAANDIVVTSDDQTLVLTGAGYWPVSQDADVLTAALDMETGEHKWVAYWGNDEIPSAEAWYDRAQYVLLDPDEEHSLSLVWTGKVFEGYDYEIVRHDLNRPAGALTYASAAQDVVWNVER